MDGEVEILVLYDSIRQLCNSPNKSTTTVSCVVSGFCTFEINEDPHIINMYVCMDSKDVNTSGKAHQKTYPYTICPSKSEVVLHKPAHNTRDRSSTLIRRITQLANAIIEKENFHFPIHSLIAPYGIESSSSYLAPLHTIAPSARFPS